MKDINFIEPKHLDFKVEALNPKEGEKEKEPVINLWVSLSKVGIMEKLQDLSPVQEITTHANDRSVTVEINFGNAYEGIAKVTCVSGISAGRYAQAEEHATRRCLARLGIGSYLYAFDAIPITAPEKPLNTMQKKRYYRYLTFLRHFAYLSETVDNYKDIVKKYISNCSYTLDAINTLRGHLGDGELDEFIEPLKAFK